MAAFEELGVCPEIIRAIEEQGWLLPTGVQQEAVPLILTGGDVLAAAETGSGKTGAFGLPILQVVSETLANVAVASVNLSSSSPTDEVRLSMDDKDAGFSVSPDGLQCQSRHDRQWSGGRGTTGVKGGKYYYEAFVAQDGISRLGWSTAAATLELGVDKHGFGYGGTAKKSHNKQFDSYGQTYGNGDYIGVLLDQQAGSIGYTKNGQEMGEAFAVPANMRGQALFPAVCLKNAELHLNFGSATFRHAPPNGYVAMHEVSAAHRTSLQGGAPEPTSGGKNKHRIPLAIILEPTRDLAEQTHKCMVDMSAYLNSPPLKIVLLVGGSDAGAQLREIKSGCDIVVGTPGRMEDFVQSNKLSLDGIRFFCIDEADRLLDTGNLDSMLKMHRKCPKMGAYGRLQSLMFSATLHSPEIRDLATQLCVNPIWVDLKGKDHVPETVHHLVIPVDPANDSSWAKNKPLVPTDSVHQRDNCAPNNKSKESLSEAIKRLKPAKLVQVIQAVGMDQCLIFCRTNLDCDNLEKYFVELGGGRQFNGKAESGVENPFSCVVLAGSRQNHQRQAAMQAFKEGDVRFLICTDVAARGIDIKGLPYVINLTLPDKDEDYIHRIGRVGRAECMGLAISFVALAPEKVWYYDKKKWGTDVNKLSTELAVIDKSGAPKSGGCCTWYDETKLLAAVEARLKKKITVVSDPASLKQHIGSQSDGGAVQYGQEKSGVQSAMLNEHVEALRPAVQVLTELERDAQHSFWAMKTQFAAGAAAER